MEHDNDEVRAETERALRAKIIELRDHGSRDAPGWPLWIVQAEALTVTKPGVEMRVSAGRIRDAIAAGGLSTVDPDGAPHRVDSREFATWAGGVLADAHRTLFPEVDEP